MAGIAGKAEAESQEVNKENETQESTENEKVERVNRLPLTRIKHIIKMDPDVTLASQDAVVMIAKAAVSFCMSALTKVTMIPLLLNEKSLDKNGNLVRISCAYNCKLLHGFLKICMLIEC